MAYCSTDRNDRWKSIAAVLLVHILLGAIIVAGLNVRSVGHAVDRLTTFDLSIPSRPPPPPPPEHRPRPKPAPAKAAPAALKASLIVAPKPKVTAPTTNPLAAAPVAGTGNSSVTGQSEAGTGAGAGGSGSGSGGGGGNTPARLVRNLTRSDYRRLALGGMSEGSAGLAIAVGTSGRVQSCQVEQSSGDRAIDAGLCPLVTMQLLFRPALDSSGRPIAFYTHYRATWRR